MLFCGSGFPSHFSTAAGAAASGDLTSMATMQGGHGLRYHCYPFLDNLGEIHSNRIPPENAYQKFSVIHSPTRLAIPIWLLAYLQIIGIPTPEKKHPAAYETGVRYHPLRIRKIGWIHGSEATLAPDGTLT